MNVSLESRAGKVLTFAAGTQEYRDGLYSNAGGVGLADWWDGALCSLRTRE